MVHERTFLRFALLGAVLRFARALRRAARGFLVARGGLPGEPRSKNVLVAEDIR